MLDFLLDTLRLISEPAYFLINPNKRVFWLYLVSSGIFALGLLWLRGGDIKTLLKKGISPSVWLSPSSLLDFKWITLNHIISVLFIVPLLGGQISFALWLDRHFYTTLGEGNMLDWGSSITAITYTVTLFIFDDFSRFFVHYLYHKLPWLWRFHAIHHSATVLTPFTLYRTHFVEMAINSGRSVVILGGISGVFMYVFDGAITSITILGASIFSVLFNMAGSNLRHSGVWLGYGKIEKYIVSPAQHQIHHSIDEKHFDKNFGSTLAVWDRLFNSWAGSKTERVSKFGVFQKENHQSLLRQLKGI